MTASDREARYRPAMLHPTRSIPHQLLLMLPIIGAHLAALASVWTGVTTEAVIIFLVLFFVRQWAVTGAYHRYFSHRTYKTSRWFQFVLAFLAQTSSQKGALWWAAHHRVHHKESDKPGDPHSPVQRSFLYSHIGWLYDDTEDTQWDKIPDLAKYPELVWLNKWWAIPPIVTGLSVWLLFGWSELCFGFFASTVLLWHNTFTINSLTHVFGKKRFNTGDESRNHWFFGLSTLGEGWHNNHHHYQSAARCGFYWWEIDITYYGLKLLSWVGLVWDLRPVPEKILAEGRAIDGALKKGEDLESIHASGLARRTADPA